MLVYLHTSDNLMLNPSTQPALEAFVPGPQISISNGAPMFRAGECILVRIPIPIQVDGDLDVDTELSASALPLTSNANSPQHFAFIRSVQINASGWLLEVLPVVSFSRDGEAVEGSRQVNDRAKEALIPLPALSHQHPTPAPLGDPLTIGSCSTPRLSFLHIVPHTFVIRDERPFKRTIPPVSLTAAQFRRIEEYRDTLRVTREAPDGDNRAQPPSSGELGGADPRGGDSGQEGTRQGSRDGATGEVSNTGSVRTWASVVSGGRGTVVAREDLGDIMTSDGILILEGVDEDADGEDCTWKEQLIMLAYSDPTWIPDLRRYLQEEREGQEKLKEERMGRLASWLQTTPLTA